MRVLSLCAAIGCSAAAASAQTLINIGTLPGYVNSWGTATSANGNVVVGSSQSSGGPFHAYRWVYGVGMQDLGVATGSYVMNSSNAYGVSADGSVVTGNNSYYFGSPIAGFRWTTSSAIALLDPTFTPFDQRPYGISGNGGWIVGRNIPGDAVRWSVGTGYQSLGLLAGYTTTNANDANFDGSIIVGDTGNGGPAWRWVSGSGMSALPAIAGYSRGSALAVSADGNYVAGRNVDNVLPSRAFRWVNGVGTSNLGVPPGFVHSEGRGISDNGLRIVGQAAPQLTVQPTDRVATIWTPYTGGKPRDLNWLLPLIGVDTTGWQLTEGNAISGDGRVLVGTGYFNGAQRAWTLRDFDCFVPLHDPELPLSFTYCQGNVAYMQVNPISLDGPVTVTWYRNNVAVVNGPTGNGSTYFGQGTNTLTIGNVQPADAGQYLVTVSNACGLRGQYRTLVVNTIPTITEQPQNTVACNGAPGYFTVASASSLPTTYQWQVQFNGAGPWYYIGDGPWLDQWANILFWSNGTATPNLTITQVNPNYATALSFRCILQNDCGAVPTNSASLQAMSIPTIDAEPGSQPVCVGGTTSFTITSFSNPVYYQWEWRYPWAFTWNTLSDGFFFDFSTFANYSVSGSSTPTVTFSSVYLNNAPSIELHCLVYNQCGPSRFPMDPVSLYHEYAPVITASPIDDHVCPAGSITSTASATSVAGHTYQWQYWNTALLAYVPLTDGVFTEAWTGRQYQVSGSANNSVTLWDFASMSFPAVIRVRCIASNACGSAATTPADLTVSPTCDFNQDASSDWADVFDLVNAVSTNINPFGAGCDDFNLDGVVDFADVIDLANAISSNTCPWP